MTRSAPLVQSVWFRSPSISVLNLKCTPDPQEVEIDTRGDIRSRLTDLAKPSCGVRGAGQISIAEIAAPDVQDKLYPVP